MIVWELTVDGDLYRVPKARILKVVREAKGQGASNSVPDTGQAEDV